MATLTLSIFVAATLMALGTWLAPRFAAGREKGKSPTPGLSNGSDSATDSERDNAAADMQEVRGLAVWWRELNTVRVLTLFGRITRSTSEDLRNALKTEAATSADKPLVVDLTGVRRIEQPGWTAILWGRDLLAGQDRTLRVLMAVGSQPYRSYFRCGVDAVLPKMQILSEVAPSAPRSSPNAVDSMSASLQDIDEVASES